ncbi:NAD-dependent epimerase/dehydratase family protein [Acidobacteriota bacterium]
MNILVTGGAGFIGSHLVDRLVLDGYSVRILDNLEEPTHPGGLAPAYLNPHAEFIKGDIRSIADLEKAMDGIEVVFHLAATGGYRPDISRYFEVNSVGTGRLMEVIQRRSPDLKKILVASSMGVYGEGMYGCTGHGPIHPPVRDETSLSKGLWEHSCSQCGSPLKSVPIGEETDVQPARAYSISKYDQERIILSGSEDLGIPAVAMRYFLTYGPRQSPTNPYTGICTIFLTRLLNGEPPLLFEDGLQTRDMIFVGDLVEAHMLLLENDLPYQVYNIGAGRQVRIREVAESIARLTGKNLPPEIPGAYRPGETRHIWGDISRLEKLGFSPAITLDDGLKRLTSWFADKAPPEVGFEQAQALLRSSNLVRYTSRHTDL